MMTAEAISKILLPVIDKIDQLNGNLFSRKVPPDSIKNMNYQELKYWNKWHELIEKAEIKAYEKNKVK